MAVLSRGQITISNLIDGKISYTHQAWADGIVNGIGSVGFSLTDSIGKKYIGFYSDFNEQASTDPTKYKWVETSNAIEQEIAYAWSADGTDRFTTEYPNENLLSDSMFFVGNITGTNGVFSRGYSNQNNAWLSTEQAVSVSKGQTYVTKGYDNAIFEKYVFYNNGVFVSTSISNPITIPDGVNQLRVCFYFPMSFAGKDISVFLQSRIKLELGSTVTLYTPSIQDDYDNAVPRYIGRSLKDSNSPSDYQWEPNPERKPWTSYAQGLNGEGFSLVPYGEQLQLGTNQPFVMGYGISNTTWKDDWAYLDTKTGSAAVNSEILPQNGAFYNFMPENGKTYTQSIRIKTDGKYSPTNTLAFSWYTSDGHNSQQASILPLNSNEYLIYSTYTWDKTGKNLRAFDIFNLYTAFGFRDSTATYLAFKEPKLELANTMGVPTPWTPAPSDTDENGDTGQAQLAGVPRYIGTAALPYEDPYKYTYTLNPEWVDLNNNLISQGKVDSGSYQNDRDAMWESISNMVTAEEADNINDMLKDIQEKFKGYTDPDKGTAAKNLADLDSRLVKLVNDLGEKVAKWNFIDTWMTAGKEGFSISNKNSTVRMLITNKRLSFISNGEEVAYFDDKQFQIKKGIILDGLRIGNHQEISMGKDHTVTVWIDD